MKREYALQNLEIPPEVISKVPAKFSCHYKILPIAWRDNLLEIAMVDPLDIHILDELRLFLGLEIKPVLASEKEILQGIHKHYGVGADTLERIMAKNNTEPPLAINQSQQTTEDLEAMVEDASIIKFVNQILIQAVKERATDVHLEPFQDQLRVRFRIDGILYETKIAASIKFFHLAIVSRIKIMAHLNIAERRLSQDGRIKIRLEDNELDLRISIIPSVFGESVHIRILSPAYLLSLDKLGLSQDNLQIIESMIKTPHGIIFVTGPTGSGKSTTLYACLSKINCAALKIITIEDPIEYQIPGITQIQVQPKISLTFSQGLRSILRHDPDVMMIGEVRDSDTAETAIRAALTGHLVLSTLHTNDASGAITRLLDMGVEPYLVSSSLECLVAQRLVRIICPECKIEVRPEREILEEVGLKLDNRDTFWHGQGCEKCKFTGYLGRTGIYEILVIDNKIRELILRRAFSHEIKKIATANGMRTLRQDGLDKALKGLTTLNEVMRVTQKEEGACA